MNIDEYRAGDLGFFFIDRLMEEIQNLHSRIDELESKNRTYGVKGIIEENRNRLFGETLLVAILLFRHDQENDSELLEQAKQRLQNIVKMAGNDAFYYSMDSKYWEEFIDVCGKSISTRILKGQINLEFDK